MLHKAQYHTLPCPATTYARKKGHWHRKPEVQVHLHWQISFFGISNGISGTVLTEKVMGEMWEE
eukprot:15359944-Ditylum_brightwellii.AAC.1